MGNSNAWADKIPSSLTDDFLDVVTHDRVSSEDDLTLFDIRLRQLLRQLAEGGCLHRLEELRESFQELKEAHALELDLNAAIEELDKIINGAENDKKVWDEILARVDQKSRVASREVKSQEVRRRMVDAELANKLVLSVFRLAAKYITDQTARDQFARDCEKEILPVLENTGKIKMITASSSSTT